ncbi:hypothetical protein N7495_003605 [Penicillium taxi]|uniref:uncharacterized protein n=1 Tax=Penicillium taxi TaxID=168475 RepID=UPI002545BD90|nr:uncharacterized protein N7495_003605 [Penicillium taxi]KAJ5898861.1 hypothetical protein N7495_003605 [Penicillium taxi]
MPDNAGNTSWVTEDTESTQYALIIKNEKRYDNHKSLKIHSVVVQSETLKTFLGKVLEGYPTITTTLQRLEFTAPFKPLVHRWDDLVKIREEEEDAVTKEYIDLFYTIFEVELRDILSRKNDMTSNGVITHELLWTIFEPSGLVISTSYGRTSGFLFKDTSVDYRTKAWVIEAKRIAYDGTTFGFEDQSFIVPFFNGTKLITSLAVSPLRYHADKDTIQASLLANGKIWEEHQGFHHKQYEGVAYGFLDHGIDDDLIEYDLIEYHVKSRVIIDTEAFKTFHDIKIIYIDNTNIDDILTDEQRIVSSGLLYGYFLEDKK